jgi:hypothetical protein
MYKRASCTTVPGDLRAFIFPAPPATGTLAVPPNWLNFSREDGNLNGVLDAGEDGSNGGTVNGRLDPLLIPDVTATTATIFLPANSGATDCLYFALGIGLDANALSVNPPTDTIFGEMVISPLVSMNPIPFAGDTGNPIADLVENISAVKSQGKLAVAWSTITELTTEGFNVIGTKKGGGEIKLNSALIPAQEGTTGLGASYSAVFDGSKLKGSTSVFIDLVKIDGTTARFGPVGF